VAALVTGATGFVGLHAARALLAGGHEVRVLARSLEKAERLFRSERSVEIVVGDMTDSKAVASALSGCELVVHAAATVSFDPRQAERLREANLVGTRAIVGGAAERGARAIVYVSSLTAIFDPSAGAPGPDSPVLEGGTPYARSKAAAERLVRELADEGAPVATVYPYGVIGPDDPGWSESVAAFRGFLANTLDTTGGVSFLDVRDLARFGVRLLETETQGRFVLGGHFFTWDELAALLETMLGRPIRRFRAPAPLLRMLGSALDGVRRVRPVRSLISREGMEYATRTCPLPNSEALAVLGVTLRPPEETFADPLRWMLATGKLKPHHAPALAPGSVPPVGGQDGSSSAFSDQS
jgi:nucleoside-diphosphate-sugar epimerase